MADMMVLAFANVLKSVVLGMLAVVSFCVHGPGDCEADMAAVPADAVLCCEQEAVLQTVEIVALKRTLERLGSVVPPIRVETLYSPDVLHPAIVIVRRVSGDQAT